MQSYSGKDCHKYVEQLLKKGKELHIVSPYIDNYYANFILRNSGGKNIRIISSSIERDAEKTLTKGRFPKELAISTLLVAIADIMLYLLSFYLYSFYIFMAVLLLIMATFLLSIKTPKNIRLKIPKEFVHAKIYLSENGGIEGSANLTYKGMHKNIEHIKVVLDPNELRSLEMQFEEIWKSST